MLKEVPCEGEKRDGRVNIVQGEGGWRTPEDTWMEMGEAEGEVFFVNMVQIGEPASDEELEAEIARTEKAIDDCFRRRAKRAGVAVSVPEDRHMSKEERELLSEKLGDGVGVWAKRRRETEELDEEAIGVEIKKTEKALQERVGAAGSRCRKSGLGSLLLSMAVLCLLGGQVSAFTAYDCSNRSNIIELYSLLEPNVCAAMDKAGEVKTTVYMEIV
jgi:hypothetical protein